MENLGKKVGYLKGLLESLEDDRDSVSGRLFREIAEVLEAVSDRLEAMDEMLGDLNAYVEDIDADLTELEGGCDEDDDDFPEDGDEAFEDDIPDAEDRLRLLRPTPDREAPSEPLSCNVCPECGGVFFVSLYDEDGSEYLCPHCHRQIRPTVMNRDDTPIVRPVKRD